MNIPKLPIPYHPSQEILDSTKIQTYQDCPRLFFYEYLLGWRSAQPNNHLQFGKAVHIALEHIILNNCTGKSVVEAIELFNDEYRLFFPPETDIYYYPKTPTNFFYLLTGDSKNEGYLRKYIRDTIDYSVYKTEFGGTVHLSPEHTLAFKMDTILCNNRSGKYFSLEHKTKGSNYVGDNFQYEHTMGIQVGTYTHVLNCLFPPEDVEGVTINLLCLKKTKKPDFILQRFPIMLSNSYMYKWLENTKKWMDLIQADIDLLETESASSPIMKSFPMCGRSCTNWGRTCRYLELCLYHQNPLQHIDRIPADMKIEFWNPLEEELREVLTL